MKLELLPNEILIECFQYLNAYDLFYSFDKLNRRFNQLIRHIPLCIDFENINKLLFDKLCAKISINPEIKAQIYSIHLPNDNLCFQTDAFWSLFKYEEFIKLQIFISNFSLAPHHLTCSNTNLPRNLDVKIQSSILLFSKLQTLSILQLDSLPNTQETSSITKLTLSICNLTDFFYIITHATVLEYFRIIIFNDEPYFHVDKSLDSQCHYHLKDLVVDDMCITFKMFELCVQQTSNLKRLRVSASNDENIMDADRWERLITLLLPHLDSFKFVFSCNFDKERYNIIFQRFQTDFWRKQHHWFTEMMIGEYSTLTIYTKPYSSNNFTLSLTHETNNFNTFVNIINLTLDYRAQTENCQYYFPNVTALTSGDSKHYPYLKKIVNLSKLKFLHVSHHMISPNDPSAILEIFKEAPHLSSLIISWNHFPLFFTNSELCKYFNRMIKTLNINNDIYGSINDPFNAEKFCQVFSNLEHLDCKSGSGEQLLFLLNRLPKLLTFKIEWGTRLNPEENLIRFKNQIEKLNVIYDVKTECSYHNFMGDYDDLDEYYWRPPSSPYYTTVMNIWFGNEVSQ